MYLGINVLVSSCTGGELAISLLFLFPYLMQFLTSMMLIIKERNYLGNYSVHYLALYYMRGIINLYSYSNIEA